MNVNTQENTTQACTNFHSLQLNEQLLRAIREEDYTIPTAIQSQAIPIILQGTDLLGCAQTGTGKTAAFALPILQLLSSKPAQGKRKIRSLILTPTRELAMQIYDSFTTYGKYSGLKYTVVFGGVNQNPQIRTLQQGVDILIATPGRLLDLKNQGHINLQDVEIFVLDEADRMLDMGFINDIKKIIAVLPKKKQTLFFSATMPSDIKKLSNTILHNPAYVTVTPVASTAEKIEQFVYFVDKERKSDLLLECLKNNELTTVLVFTRTKHGADKVVRVLQKAKITAEAIHGNKTQNARQRALDNFKAWKTRVLVATDIAARGIDVDNLGHVINYDLPNIAETYVHRIGRTGRAGAEGTAYSFCNAEERPYLRDIERLIAQKIQVVDNHPFPALNTFPEKTAEKMPGSSMNAVWHSKPKHSRYGLGKKKA